MRYQYWRRLYDTFDTRDYLTRLQCICYGNREHQADQDGCAEPENTSECGTTVASQQREPCS